MAEETLEEKVARYEFVLDAYVRELAKLREENERLRSAAGAHDILKAIYLDPDAPQGNRIKAAQAALPHETPRLNPVPPPLDLVAEPIEPLSAVVERQGARCDRLQALSLEERAALITGVSNDNGGNGSGD
jgi:hypothetical protein